MPLVASSIPAVWCGYMNDNVQKGHFCDIVLRSKLVDVTPLLGHNGTAA